MKRSATALCAVLALTVTGSLEALPIGAAAPDFANLDTADGGKVSLKDFKADVLVIAITCNHCPVAVANEDRLIQFAKDHCGPDGKVALVAINVNNLEADKLPAMKERAKEKGFNFPYAYDPSQQIAKALGAKVTPEFFVFDKNRKLVYTGKFDDSVLNPSEVKTKFVEEAVKAVLEGKQPPKPTKAEGCGVKFD